MPEPRVAIVGGGLAGLAAASVFAVHGIPAVVLESRPRLGGRASSFLDAQTKSYVDNCQHVSMGCCTNFAHFLRTVGLQHFFRRETALFFIGPGGTIHRFSAARWPCPFHLVPALRNLTYLSKGDRRSISRALLRLARSRDRSLENQPFSRWLDDHDQSPTAVAQFWEVVLVSALSESLDRISVPHARKVFVDAFLRHRDGWCVDIPTVPLGTLYGPPLIDWFARHGVEVRLQDGVERLEAADGRITGAVLRNGSPLRADEFIVTLPHYRLADILPPDLAASEIVRGFSRIESAPISSLHLWFDRPFTELPHAVFIGRLSQWMFNRTALASSTPSPTAEEHYYQVVISASRAVADLPAERVVGIVLDELAETWPAVRGAQLLHRRLVTEHRAVFSVQPGTERLRPPQQSPICNLQWAGDWTRTGWPATMEGAVRSGYLAAENVLRRLGRPQRVLQPDLPVAFWSRCLLGIS